MTLELNSLCEPGGEMFPVDSKISRSILGPPTLKVAGLVLLIVFLLSPAAAQEEYEVLEEEQERGAARAKAAKEAESFLGDDLGPPISYADILKDPDNVQLNFRYARQQIEKGNMRSAVATLERLLLINPDQPLIRLYYGAVLFRLDNSDEAEQQFQAVKEYPLDAETRARVDRYLKDIEQRRKTTRFSLSTSFGGQYDFNRNSASKWGTNLVLEVPTGLEDENRRKEDWAVIGSGTVSFAHDLGLQERHELNGSFTYYHDEQFNLAQLTTRSGTLTGGLTFRYPWFELAPMVILNKVGLSHERYSTSFGAQVAATIPIGRDWKINGGFRYANEKFYALTESTSAVLFSGPKWDYFAGASYAWSQAHRTIVSGKYTVKRARANYYAYRSYETSLSHAWLLGSGQFLTGSLATRWKYHREADSAVSDMTRHEFRVKTSLTYGVPVQTLLNWAYLTDLPDLVEDILHGWTWTHSGEFLWQNSLLGNYDYKNIHWQSMMLRRWDF